MIPIPAMKRMNMGSGRCRLRSASRRRKSVPCSSLLVRYDSGFLCSVFGARAISSSSTCYHTRRRRNCQALPYHRQAGRSFPLLQPGARRRDAIGQSSCRVQRACSDGADIRNLAIRHTSIETARSFCTAPFTPLPTLCSTIFAGRSERESACRRILTPATSI